MDKFKITLSIKKLSRYLFPALFILIISALIIFAAYYYRKTNDFETLISGLNLQKANLSVQLASAKKNFENLKNQDQYKINKQLENDIKNIETSYQKSVTSYEKLLDLKAKNVKTTKIDEAFAKVLKLLSEKNYASAEGTLIDMDKQIQAENDKLISDFKIPENLPIEKAPPSSGYRRQQVQTNEGTFMVDIISADLNSTRVIVDTASESDCADNCPVLSLADYVSRNGAFAGINGSFFCPATYPQCAGKTNSFDTLLMNKNKKYFNSDNNVYSTVPAVIFSGNSARFVGQTLEWGRDTGVDAVIANYPLLILNGQNQFGGSSDPKISGKGTRNFVGTQGNMVYIGSVHNATTGEESSVLKTLGLQNALGLDQGGSTALWFGGYKLGPGRGIPNAILFVRK